MDIVTTNNTSNRDINPNFLYCASIGHHSNSRGALLELCATGNSGLQSWIRGYDKGRIRILGIDIPVFPRLLSTVFSERDCSPGHCSLFVYSQFSVLFVIVLTERIHLISVYNSHTSAKSAL